jgi:Gpi18-like mannosyltransferase
MQTQRSNETEGSLHNSRDRSRRASGLSRLSDSGPRICGCAALWMFLGVTASLLLRLSLFDFESRDYRTFLSQWYDFFLDHGRWQGLASAPHELRSYCYPPLYMYLISLSTLLPLPKLYAIKLISAVPDYVAAWFVFKIVRGSLCPSLSHPMGEGARMGMRESSRLAVAAALAFLFLPTVVMNGALWGQCDILYGTGLLASLCYVLERRSVAALVAFGFALSLKPQAVFWCPFLAGLLVSGRLPGKHMWIPVAVYVGCAVPAMLAGQPVWDALAHWTAAAVNPLALTLGAPNWYQWVLEAEPRNLFWPGVALTLVATAALMLLMRQRRGYGLTERQWLVSLALLSVLFPPFFLPGVHERYFFAGDVVSLVYAFCVPDRWWVALLVQFTSAFACLPFLFGTELAPSWLLALTMAAAIGMVVLDLTKGLFASAEPVQEANELKPPTRCSRGRESALITEEKDKCADSRPRLRKGQVP